MDIQQFVKERDEALLSLDKNKIRAYMKKYHVRFEPQNETVFWAGVHKAITKSTLQRLNKKQNHEIGWLLMDSSRIFGD